MDAPFSPRLFAFLAELEAHNDKDWFARHKRRYEADVRGPALAFIRAMAPHLEQISGWYVASDRKVGGSLMRVHRDVRFSPDKRPFKTNVGIQFRHARAKDVHAPGFYVHLANDGCFLGVGCWRPEPKDLGAIRDLIVEQPTRWEAALADEAFTATWSRSLDEALKRPPRGYDADHPHVEDLKLKSHTAMIPLDPDAATAPGFVADVAARFAAARPYMAFLCEAVGASF